jgi:hypothetical protein
VASPVWRALRELEWANIGAAAFCLAFFAASALYFSTYRAKPMSEPEIAASRARAFVNCGAGMFDVVPHDHACPRFDAIGMEVQPCQPECDAWALTLHADGRAVLDVAAPEPERGRYTARVGSHEYRELSNLVALLRLDTQGHVVPAPPGAEMVPTVRGGCGGRWSSVGNQASKPGELLRAQQCLVAYKDRADWLKRGGKRALADDAAPAPDGAP